MIPAMTVTRPAPRGLKSRIDRAVLAPLGIILVLTLAACSSGETSEKTARKLAGSPQAIKARDDAEASMRNAIAFWDAHTSLTLGLVTVDDVCIRGRGRELFSSSGDDQYKIRCLMSVTAYFGADPRHMADTIDGILSAGDRTGSVVPFGHDFQYARKVVDYYNGKPGDPQGPGTGEPTELFAAATATLNWDQVTTRVSRKLIDEPHPCAPADPPLRRCLREPANTQVTNLRRKFGTVFKLTFATSEYYVVRK